MSSVEPGRAGGVRTAGPGPGAAVSHGEWEPAAGRTDPLEILALQATTRLADLVPIRYGRMAASPFAFFRGAAAVMAADLAATPTGLGPALRRRPPVNFGGSPRPSASLVFDLNDFDETLPGPFEWDVKRLAASLEVAARGRGFDAPPGGRRWPR